MKKNKLPQDKLYWLFFSTLEISGKKFSLLLSFFETAKKAYEAREGELLEIGLPKKDVSRLIALRKKLDLHQHYVRLRENKIDCYFLDSDNYPKSLKNIDDPPFVIYCRGKILKKDQKAIAIVGSRKATFYGKSVAETFSRGLVKNGFTIVSGLAYGIDTVAHKSALLAGGRTIAVLGSSLDCLYPSENKLLAEEICKSGAVISEYPLDTSPLAHHFPRRNRLVSGLTRGVIVVEAEERSGALITARIAGEQGREIFTVSGPISSSTCAGPVKLANSGAKLVRKVDDVLEEMEDLRDISVSSEEMVLKVLKKGPLSLDIISVKTGFSKGELFKILSSLLLKAKVLNLHDMIYSLKI